VIIAQETETFSGQKEINVSYVIAVCLCGRKSLTLILNSGVKNAGSLDEGSMHYSRNESYRSLSLLRWGEAVPIELRPLTGLLSILVIHKWILCSGGMVLTGENRRTGRQMYSSPNSFTTNPTWIALGANRGPWKLPTAILIASCERGRCSDWLVVCSLTTLFSVTKTMWRRMKEWYLNDELERIWKEVVVT
jgi:hypothetical protein